MLDLPELLAPARIVRGFTSIDCALLTDLKPEIVISEIPAGSGRVSSRFPDVDQAISISLLTVPARMHSFSAKIIPIV